MGRAIEKGPVAYFSFDAYSIHGAVIKQGVFKRRASLQLAKGAYEDGKIQDENAFSLAFDELCRKLKIRRGVTCAVALDETEVLSRKVEIPSNIMPDEIRSYLFMEIGNSIILPFDDVSFDYEVITEEEAKTEVMLHAVPVELTKALRTYMKKRGLVLQKIVPRSVAVANGIMRLADIDPLESTLLWHVTPFSHQLLVLEEGQIRFIRSIETHLPYDTNTRDGIVKYSFHDTDEVKANQIDDWLNELSRFLDFYRYSLRADGRSIDELFVSGTVPEVEALVRAIEAEALVPVTAVEEPLPIAHTIPLSHQMLPLLGMATIGRERSTNLIHSTDVTLRWPIVAGLLALLLGGGATGYLYYEVDQLKRDEARLNEQIQLVNIYQNEQVNSKGQQVLALDETVNALSDMEKHAVPALRALTEQLPPSGYVLTYQYADASLMSVRAQFETLPDLNDFQRSLLTDERFEAVNLLGVTTETKSDGEEREFAQSEKPLPRYIGEFTFMYVGVDEQPTTDGKVVQR